jgi:hypothetical protein
MLWIFLTLWEVVFPLHSSLCCLRSKIVHPRHMACYCGSQEYVFLFKPLKCKIFIPKRLFVGSHWDILVPSVHTVCGIESLVLFWWTLHCSRLISNFNWSVFQNRFFPIAAAVSFLDVMGPLLRLLLFSNSARFSNSVPSHYTVTVHLSWFPVSDGRDILCP